MTSRAGAHSLVRVALIERGTAIVMNINCEEPSEGEQECGLKEPRRGAIQ